MQKHERFWSGEKMLKKFTTGMRRETEILYQMYGKAICAIAYKYLRDNELAEDCLQVSVKPCAPMQTSKNMRECS